MYEVVFGLFKTLKSAQSPYLLPSFFFNYIKIILPGVPSVTLTGSQRVAELYSDKLAGKLNKDVTCAVSTSFTDSHTGGMVSPPATSNTYWAGIKVVIFNLLTSKCKN